jgi:Cu-Zn family superoxide dismutase
MSFRITATIGGLTVAAACQMSSAKAAATDARQIVVAGTTLADSTGRVVGTVRLIQDPSGALAIKVRAFGLTPGLHGIHFHSVGRCDGSSFATAGGHFNPTGRSHGLASPAGAHAGDLPNLSIGLSGEGQLSTRLSPSVFPEAATLLDADGAAVIVHANPDDGMTDPSGNSGARIACGVLQSQGS